MSFYCCLLQWQGYSQLTAVLLIPRPPCPLPPCYHLLQWQGHIKDDGLQPCVPPPPQHTVPLPHHTINAAVAGLHQGLRRRHADGVPHPPLPALRVLPGCALRHARTACLPSRAVVLLRPTCAQPPSQLTRCVQLPTGSSWQTCWASSGRRWRARSSGGPRATWCTPGSATGPRAAGRCPWTPSRVRLDCLFVHREGRAARSCAAAQRTSGSGRRAMAGARPARAPHRRAAPARARRRAGGGVDARGGHAAQGLRTRHGRPDPAAHRGAPAHAPCAESVCSALAPAEPVLPSPCRRHRPAAGCAAAASPAALACGAPLCNAQPPLRSTHPPARPSTTPLQGHPHDFMPMPSAPTCTPVAL